MPPNDLNSRIALAKGWTWHEEDFFLAPDFGSVPELRTHWLAPIAKGERYAVPGTPPDYVGTLEGVSGMLRELNEHEKTKGGWLGNYRWSWKWVPEKSAYLCKKADGGGNWEYPLCYSPDDRPGHCVGEAYMSVKEATDES